MAKKQLLTDILSTHADRILQEQGNGASYAELVPVDQELPSLLSLADHVKVALQPVRPEQPFRDQLHRDLLAAAQLRRLEEENARHSLSVTQISLIVSTTISGLIALSGLIFLYRKQRQTQRQT